MKKDIEKIPKEKQKAMACMPMNLNKKIVKSTRAATEPSNFRD
jgi:hypothetical protein